MKFVCGQLPTKAKKTTNLCRPVSSMISSKKNSIKTDCKARKYNRKSTRYQSSHSKIDAWLIKKEKKQKTNAK